MARIEKSIEVNVPVRSAYKQLARFEQYPRFMEDVRQVRQIDDTHLRWHTKSGNLDLEWDAELTQQVPDRCIAWRNSKEPHYAGKIELQPLAQDKTRIVLTIDVEPGQQMLAQHGDAEGVLAQRAEHDLARFKKFMEGLEHEAGPVRQESAQLHQDAQPGREQPPQERQPWFPNLLQAWDEPLHMMRRMSEEMDHLVGRFIGRSGLLYGKAREQEQADWTPAIDVAQEEDRLVICAELPGVRRDEVRVEIKNDRVTIEGERRAAQQPQAQEMHSSERSYGHFYRVIALPEGAEPDAASAALRDGLLEITVPVPERGRRGRRIDIRTP